MAYTKKIGILGGTFNPIHISHLLIAENARDEFDLDEVWLMPAYIPPHKRKQHILSDEVRLEMVKRAVEDSPQLIVSDYEIQLKSVSYTAQTLTSLTELYPEVEFYFIVGADSLFEMHKWYHPEVIFEHAHILAAMRNDVDAEQLYERAAKLEAQFGARISCMSIPSVNISSTLIRERAAAGKTIRYMLPESVRAYILEHHLYEKMGDEYDMEI